MEYYLNVANKCINAENELDYRISAFAIVSYYNLLMIDAGNKIPVDVKETFPFDKKIFLLSIHIPELSKYNETFKEIVNVRHKLAHNDQTIPSKVMIINIIKKAAEIKTGIDELIEQRKNNPTKKSVELNLLMLKDKMNHFKNYDLRYKENIERYDYEISLFFDKIKYYSDINVGSLDDKSKDAILKLMEHTIQELALLYDKVYSYCPACGGDLQYYSEQEASFDKNHEPYLKIWGVLRCTNCSRIIEKEDITYEHMKIG